MSIQQWSDHIWIIKLRDEPQFSDTMNSLRDRLEDTSETPDIAADLASVTHVTSSNISQLLRTRQSLVRAEHRLRLCGIQDAVWTTLLTTGLDKVFEYSSDVAGALATLQLNRR